MNSKKDRESKHWVLLEHLPYQHSRRLLLILFLYALAFTLLLVGLRMFCHNLQAPTEQSAKSTCCAAKAQKRFCRRTTTSPQSYIPKQTEMLGLPAIPDKQNADNTSQIQQDIANHIIRLHVIAHSDSDEDQALKLKVRNEVLSRIQNPLTQANTQTAAETVLKQMIPLVHEIAQNKIQAEGYDYSVHVVMEERYFPAKTYGDLTFPPGNYHALCIEIGNAEGKNWWCVLFPSLCFVDETTAEVPEPSKEKLKNSLSKEAYQSLSNQNTPTPTPSVKPEFHSAIYDWFRKR